MRGNGIGKYSLLFIFRLFELVRNVATTLFAFFQMTEIGVYFILLFVINIKMELLLEFATFIFEIGLLHFFLAT